MFLKLQTIDCEDFLKFYLVIENQPLSVLRGLLWSYTPYNLSFRYFNKNGTLNFLYLFLFNI